MKLHKYSKVISFLLVSVMMVTGCGMGIIPQDDNEMHNTDIPLLPIKTVYLPSIAPNLTRTPAGILPYEGEKEILHLYTDNGGCQLPCLWGIEPGKTSTEEVITRFSKIGKIYEEDYRWSGEYKSRGVEIITPFEINLYNEKKWGLR
jgi:hypothetical protein